MRRFELRLTRLADQDLNDLYLEGLTVWGMVQADRQYDGLLERFDRICEHPRMYPVANTVREGYRRSVYGRHSIYYVIDGDAVEIRAVVKRQDISAR